MGNTRNATSNFKLNYKFKFKLKCNHSTKNLRKSAKEPTAWCTKQGIFITPTNTQRHAIQTSDRTKENPSGKRRRRNAINCNARNINFEGAPS